MKRSYLEIVTLSVLLAGPLHGQAVPVGEEFQVNSYTFYDQVSPGVAASPGGEFVAVWFALGSPGSDNSSNSVSARRFGSDGSPQSGDFQVNSYTTNDQIFPAVAMGSSGEFVVVWRGGGSYGSDTSGASIHAQRFASDGAFLGGELQVNSYTSGHQVAPAVTMDPSGGFVVVWASNGSYGTDATGYSIQGQRFASDGTFLGSQFQVNTYTTNTQYFSAVAAGPGGEFVVVWESVGSPLDSSSYSVLGQRFGSDGSPAGSEFQVNTYTTNTQARPAVATHADGSFVVVWHSVGSNATDTSAASIQGQRFTSDGTPSGGEFQVNSYTTGSQFNPRIAAGPGDETLVAWASNGSSGSDTSGDSIQAQLFGSDGAPLGGELQVNTYTTSLQTGPVVAADANGGFVVVWSSSGSSGPDSNYSIQGQRFLVPLSPELGIPVQIPAAAGATVDVPIGLTTHGRDLASVAFSIDYDETCLELDPADGDADGIPDALSVQAPVTFEPTVFFDPGDLDGEIDVTLVANGPPFASLTDGPLVTATLTVLCSPPVGLPQSVPVLFSSAPAASFGDPNGQSVPGTASGGSVEVLGGLRGDCNGDDVIDVADVIACKLEIFDSDGSFWADTPGGTFAGNGVGCDANADTVVDAGDVSCKNRLIFGLTCGGTPFAVPASGPRLTLPEELPVTAEETVIVPVAFDPAGNGVNSIVFSLDFDESVLLFDPTDGNGDGVPDAVRFVLPVASTRSVSFAQDDTAGELDFLIADLGSAPHAFAAGALVEVELRRLDPASGPVHGAVRFSTDPAASFGSLNGLGIPGSVLIVPAPLFADGFETGDTSAWTKTIR